MSRVDRIAVGEQVEGAEPRGGGGSVVPFRGTRRPASQRQDWLETKLKGLYDEVAEEPLPDALQKLIDQLDG